MYEDGVFNMGLFNQRTGTFSIPTIEEQILAIPNILGWWDMTDSTMVSPNDGTNVDYILNKVDINDTNTRLNSSSSTTFYFRDDLSPKRCRNWTQLGGVRRLITTTTWDFSSTVAQVYTVNSSHEFTSNKGIAALSGGNMVYTSNGSVDIKIAGTTVYQKPSTNTNDEIVLSVGNRTSTSTDAFMLGSYNINYNFLDGEYFETLLFMGSPTPAEHTLIVDFLEQKYGL